MKLDVIGDVHGQFSKLTALLRHLGYSESVGAWRHPERTAIFVGDLIDRGPEQLRTVSLVRAMVECQSARCIMGNHEFNAIAWATRDPRHAGRFLRPHSKRGNRRQHRAFLTEVEGTRRHASLVAWFRTLPLWLDLGALRIVHACWHQPSIDLLTPLLGPGNTLTDEVLLRASRRGDKVFDAIEVVCKGLEIPLPHGSSFQDREGKMRYEVRLRWWQQGLKTYRDAAQVAGADGADIPSLALPPRWRNFRYDGPPVLFGHYWFTGTPAVCSSRFACLDYSAARHGPLVAYRWDGETSLSSEKLAWVR